jgi:hypothetical protein
MVRVLVLALVIVVAGCAASAPKRVEGMAELGDAILTQLVDCWPSSIKLPAPGGDLVAVVVVRFGPDGRLADTPMVVDPKGWPDDPAAQAYIGGILLALNRCGEKGFRIPQAYFDLGSPPVRLRFSPVWRRRIPQTVRT